MSSDSVKRELAEDSGNASPADSEQDSDSSLSSAPTDHFAKPKPKRHRNSNNSVTGAAMRARKYNADPAVMSKRYRWHNQLQTLTSALSSRSTRVRNRLDSNVTYDEVVHIAAAEIEKLRLEVEVLQAKLTAKRALLSLNQHGKPLRPSPSPSPSTANTSMDSAASPSPVPSEADIKPGSVSFWTALVLSEAACALVSPSLRILDCTETFARSRFQSVSKSALMQANMSILDFFPPSQTPEILLMLSSLWSFGSVSVDNFVVRDSSSSSSSDSVRLIDFTCFANKDTAGDKKVNSIVFIIRKQHLAPPHGSIASSLFVPSTSSSSWQQQRHHQSASGSFTTPSSSPSVYPGTAATVPSSTTPAFSSLAMSSSLSDHTTPNNSIPTACSTPATAITSPPLSLPMAVCKLPQSLSLFNLMSSVNNSQPRLSQFSASITSTLGHPPNPVGPSIAPTMYQPFVATSLAAYSASAASAANVTGSAADTASLYQQMKNANDSLRGRVFC